MTPFDPATTTLYVASTQPHVYIVALADGSLWSVPRIMRGWAKRQPYTEQEALTVVRPAQAQIILEDINYASRTPRNRRSAGGGGST